MFNKLKSLANTGIQSAITSIQNNEQLTNSIIEKIILIDFEKAEEFVINNEAVIPQSEIIKSTLRVLSQASNDYRVSETDNLQIRNKFFLNTLVNNIDAQKTVNALEPIANIIPFGGTILFVLKMILKYKNNN
uniref:hypothetical protein n=1 Tax=Flavobacterium sp. TaxID=239 RepID=UPI00404906AE